MSNQEPIAVIGSGCRFAGSLNSPSKLWEFLQAPYDLLRKVPSNRWDSKAFYHKDPEHHGTTNVQESYFLDEDITAFDNSFFSIQPGEAEAIDPQQRMLMETVYDSLCAAGQTIEGLRGSQTAVYVGVMCDDWSAMLASDRESTPQYAATGMARSIMSNRISYFFDWHGPSMTIDTACSSSMVAVHQAVQTIRSGESQLAVVAGSNLILHPGMYIAQSKLHMNSPSARCRMWDVDADGYGRGEGIAAVVLKPLSAAIKDGDSVECIIRAISVNQNGRTPGLTMPSAKAQAALIRDTYTRAGLDVSKQEHRPQFFQAHGTGTPAGDSQEAEGISRAFSFADKPSEKLFVGSVKTVIGHTEGAAGLASLISTSLALQHGLIPPNMHFNALNPRLLPFYTHLHVPSSATTWPVLPPGQPRRASINSFGFGGTNVHAILEAYQSAPSQDLNYPLFTPLTVSAASERSLRALLSSYSAYLKANPQISLRDFAYTLQMRRSTLSNRTVIAASSSEEAFEKMDAILRDERNVDLGTKHFGISKPKILGIFTGQGAQWPRMGARLIETSPFVAKRLAELDRMLTELPSADRPTWTLQEQLLADEAGSRVAEAAVSQPLCTAVQILLVDLLRAAGVTLHAVVGHSSGEIGAAYAAGLLPAESAIRVAYYRGLYAELARSPNGTRGAMLAVGSTFEEMSSFCDLEAFRGRLQIAARNSLTSITLAGDEDAIAEAAEMLTNEGKFARQLKVDTAYHSVHMLPCAVPYLESMDKSKVCATNGNGATWYSSVDQGHVMSTNGLKAQYWVDNMTNPVLFAPAVTAAVTQDGPFDLAIEVGPHPALKTPCLDTLQEVTGDRIPYSGMLSRGQDDVKAVSNALGFLWSHLGVGSVAFETFAQKISGASATGRPIPKLPSYPFDHSRSYWSLSRLTAAHKRATDPPHPILGRRCNERETSNEVEWRNILRVKEVGWLKGHRLQGQIVFPATGYIALAVEAIGTLVGWSNVGFITIENLVIGKAIAFNDDDSSIETVFKLKHSTGGSGERHAEFSFYSGDLYSERSPLMLSATGTITASLSEARADAIASTTPEHSTTIDIETGRFYKSLSKLGYQYSEPFYGIKSIRRKNGFATGMVQDQSGTEWEDQLLVHPGLIDSALQTCFAAFSCPGDERLWGLHVPTRFQSVTINPFFVSTCFPKRGDFLYNAIAGESKKGKLGAGLDLLSRDGAHIFMQIEGIEMVPFSAPLPENDAIFFSGFEYKLDRPNGEMAATGDGATTQEFQLAIDQERISFYYLRQLVDTLTSQERATTLPHYKHLLAWAVHAVNLVNSDKNPFIPSDCQHDTYEQIQSMLDRYRTRVDVRLLESVGENLPGVVRTRSTILEHMSKDSMLDEFYEEGFGLDIANRYLARMVGQIVHRYPQMNIFEIGAGTGGSTRSILPLLGSDFLTYTYTDISSGFFDKAQDRFKDFESRMLFKTFDMERPLVPQGFVERGYDLVIASNVLHVTDKLEETMTNVRQLLKPGGYLIAMEITSNDCLRVGLVMGSLPGWWVGAESGRSGGPTLTLPQWDALLRKCGFGGIDTVTPQSHKLHPGFVFAAQAVDDRVNILRSPLPAIRGLPTSRASQLVIVGGERFSTYQMTGMITQLLGPRYSQIICVNSIEALNKQDLLESSTVLSLTELDDPLFATMTSERLDALKLLWRRAGTVLWVTQGAKADQPLSFMTVGLGRSIRLEYPNITLQIFDIDRIHDRTSYILAEAVIRLELHDKWTKEIRPEDLLWSFEPEVYVENGATKVPRLYPSGMANKRYNTSRREIAREAEPKKERIRLRGDGSHWELEDISPACVPAASLFSEPRRRTHISQFLLQAIRIGSTGSMILCVGVDIASGDSVLAATDVAESPSAILSDWTIPLGQATPEKALVRVAAQIIARNILRLSTSGEALLVHEPDPLVAGALSMLARKEGISLVVTTSLEDKKVHGWHYIQPNLPARLVKRLLPQIPFIFVNLSQTPGSADGGRLISRYIPGSCATFSASYFFSTKTQIQTSASSKQIQDALLSAWHASEGLVQAHSSNTIIPIIGIRDLQAHSAIGEPLTVVDCSASSVTVRVRAIDEGQIFRSDRTYLLVGLSGEVGQSLCQWMVWHGARHVVLTSRQPKVDPNFIDSMNRMGAAVKCLPLDITNRESLHQRYTDITCSMPPIAGVANGAMVLEDSMFDSMSIETMTKVLGPKVLGSQLLDELFYDVSLDFFILFSSVTAAVGNSGQSNYTAANMFMTALAAQRKKRGIAGSAIDISSLIGLGYVERSDGLDEDYFSGRGLRNISEQDLHQMFAEAIVVGRPDCPANSELTSGVVRVYTDSNVNAHHRTDTRFNHFFVERPETQNYVRKSSGTPLRVQLAEAKTKTDVIRLVKESFMLRMKRTLMISQDDVIDEKTSFAELGIDSLMAVDLRSWFFKELDFDIPVLKILSDISIADLLGEVLAQLPVSVIDLGLLPEDGKVPKTPPKPAPTPRLLSEEDQLKLSGNTSDQDGSHSESLSGSSDLPRTPVETARTETDDPVSNYLPKPQSHLELFDSQT